MSHGSQGAKPRSRKERLAGDLPARMLTALKIRIAQRETTVREMVLALAKRELERSASPLNLGG